MYESERREPTGGGLPPEVEAELRRRAREKARETEGQPVAAAPGAPSWVDRAKALGPIAVFLVLMAGKLKFLLGGLKVAKFALPVLKTGGTMLLSIWIYAQHWGWQFAAGFVLLILAHEMGHVYAAWKAGVPISAPFFIPFAGALILQKRAAGSVWDEAVIGIGGPVAGTLGVGVCLLLYGMTQNPLFLGLAYVGAFINLFNLTPVFPMDGGWITAAISPRLWLAGSLVLLGLFLTGRLRNPFILLLILLSLPRLWHGLRTGNAAMEGQKGTTPQQRWQMGVAYLGLAGLLFWLMTVTHLPAEVLAGSEG